MFESGARGQDLIKAPDGFARLFSGRRETPALGTLALLKGYDAFPWIRAISDKIGHAIGSTDWGIMAGDLEIEKHPLLDLLHRPNPVMSGMAFFKWSGTHFALTNEIFWLIERNGVGMPVELWPLPANWVVDIPKMGNPDGQYELSFGGVRTKVPAIDIIYIRDFSPANPYGRSSSPAKALGDEIESDEFAAKYVKGFFLNNARPDIIIYSEDKDNPLDKEAAERLEVKWLERLQGFLKRHRPFFMPGKIGIKEIQSDLKSMDLVDQRKFWRDITIQVYGIPPETLGIIESSNRATISASNFILQTQVIVPRLDIIKDGMTLSLASQFDERIVVSYVSPVKEDLEHRLKVTTRHPYAFELDEIRNDAGRESLPDDKGKIFPYLFNTLFSETPGGGNIDVAPPPAPHQPAEPVDEIIVPGSIKAIDDDQIEEILLVMGTDEFNPSVHLANRETVGAFGQSIVDQVSTGVAFDLSSSKVEAFLAEQSGDRIVRFVNETTMGKLRKTLSEGSAAGEGADQLASRISATFDEAKTSRAFRIARTESVRASNFGSLSGMRQMRIKQKQWLTVGDGNVRATHATMNGQVVDTPNAFTSGSGFQAQHPGAFGVAAEDIECRCSILAVIAPEGSDINIPSTKDFERERSPYDRLIEHAYIRGFEIQEGLVLEAFNLI